MKFVSNTVASLTISIVVTLVSICNFLLITSFEGLFTYCIMLVVFLTIIRMIIYKGFELDFYTIVCFGFVYLIFPDIKNYPNGFDYQSTLYASKLVCLSFIILLATFFVRGEGISIRTNTNNDAHFSKIKRFFIFSLLLIFLVFMVEAGLFNSRYGRGSYSSIIFNILRPFLIALSYVLPGIFAILYKKGHLSKKTLFLLVMPIFLVQIMFGIRFVFLFSSFIFLSFLVELRKVSFYKKLILFVSLFAVSTTMAVIRGKGIENLNVNSIDYSERVWHSEGLIYYFTGVTKYFDDKEHSYMPIQSSFPLYFYIPRSIWQSKPKLIGRWILEKEIFTSKYGAGHSGAVTFIGPFYVDFGLSCFFIIFIFSIFLRKVEVWYYKNLGCLSYKGIIAASIIPTLFFGLRSLNTSLMTFIVVCILSFLLLPKHKN